jgi:myo-inositol 2-dehydrogenase/D-chiro-inositol 1-dehydrogenase
VTAPRDRLRLAVIGAGFIVPVHLRAFDRIGRTTLVGVASRTLERAAAVTETFGGRPFDDPDRLLDEARPDVVLIATPPYRTPSVCELVLRRALPFLVEKPLAAADPTALAGLADAVERSGLVVAVGYHLRGLEALPGLRERLLAAPPVLVVGRWLDRTVSGDWWGRVDRSGGQFVEQATHLVDLARVLAGEASVVGAAAADALAAVRHAPSADVVAATAAVVRFDLGAVGAFAATRVLAGARIGLEVAAPGILATVTRSGEAGPPDWTVTIDEGDGARVLPGGRDPYEVQDEAFLRAVRSGDPSAVLCRYGDALATDRLTRAIVAATGMAG